MPTAKFVADFDSFNNAVQSADVKLSGFEGNANKVQTSLNRMANGLSGTKLIQDATLMVAAVEKIGGVSALTEKELAGLGARATEAAEKMRAMGDDVPPGLQKIADAAKDATKAHGELGGTVRGLITDFAAMFTARAAFNFVRDTIEEASALNDLGQQTHINVEELQLLAGSMSEFGVDADTLGKGLYKLSRGIAGGDQSVTTGLHLMGMSLKDVEGLNGKDLFLKIEDGLAQLQGGLRDTAAAELFGGRLGAAMAGASEGIQGALEKWQRLNQVASKESVEAMDAFGESIARSNKNLSAIAANMIGPVAEGFNAVFDAVDKGGSKWAIFVAMVKDFASSSALTGASTSNLAKVLDDLNQKAQANATAMSSGVAAHASMTAAIDTRTSAERFMAALEADAAKALDGTQVKNLDHLKDIGALNEKNAAAIGVNSSQFEKYKAGIETAKKATEDLAKAQAESDSIALNGYANRIKGLDAIAQASLKAYGFAGQIAALAQLDAAENALTKSVYDSLNSQKDRARVVEESTQRHIALMNEETAIQTKQAAVVNAAVLAEFDAQVKLNAEWGLNASGAIKLQHTALDTLTEKLTALHLLKVDGISQEKQEALLMKDYTDALLRQAQALDDVSQATDKTATATAAANTQIQGFRGVVLLDTNDLKTLNAELSKYYDQLASRSPVGDLSGPSGVGQPRVPGAARSFEYGGPTGAGGPAFLHDGEFVVPKGGALVSGGSGGNITINFTGVIDQATAEMVASKVSDVIVRRTGLKLGNA